MTTAGGLGHTLPFRIADFHLAIGVAIAVHDMESASSVSFATATWTRRSCKPRFSDRWRLLVFITGWLIGSS